MFHSYVHDSIENMSIGAFFASLREMPTFTHLNALGRPACTGLSTDSVDKGESPFAAASCDGYLQREASIARNCRHLTARASRSLD